jgi:hypothetical protein
MNMTTNLWQRILKVAKFFESRFKETGTPIPDVAEPYDWYNRLYTSPAYRRAHVEIVDKTATHKILVLHCTVFPHYNDPSPIWGFDAVCGPNKITGAFHDFSDGGDPEHFMMKHFAETVKDVAAGNVSDEAELENLCQLAEANLDYYLNNVGKTAQSEHDYWPNQSRYNANNKLNPHVARSMISMGVEEEVIKKFIDEVLYPEHRL